MTRLVEALMEPSSPATQALQDTDDYLTFDPKSTRGRPSAHSVCAPGSERDCGRGFELVGEGGYLRAPGPRRDGTAAVGDSRDRGAS